MLALNLFGILLTCPASWVMCWPMLKETRHPFVWMLAGLGLLACAVFLIRL